MPTAFRAFTRPRIPRARLGSRLLRPAAGPFRAGATYDSAGATPTSFNLTAPGSIVAGDVGLLLVVWVGTSGETPPTCTSTGWTDVVSSRTDGNMGWALLTRTRQGGDSSTVTVVLGNGRFVTATAGWWSGVGGIGVVGTPAVRPGSQTTTTAASIGTAAVGRTVVAAFAERTVAAGTTATLDQGSPRLYVEGTSTTDTTSLLADVPVPTVTSGTVTATYTGTGSGNGAGVLVELVPAYIQNSFESGQPTGTAITTGNSTGTGNTPFDLVTATASCTANFSTAHPAHGTLGFECLCGGTAGESYVSWIAALGAARTVSYERLCLYLSALPGTQTRLVRWLSSSTVRGSVQVSTAGKLLLTDASGSTVATSTTTLPTTAQCRIEARIVGDISAGQLEAKIFLTLDATTPDETLTVSGLNTGGSLDRVRYGQTGTAVASITYYPDDVASSATGYIGPAVWPPAGGAVSAAATLTATATLAAGATLAAVSAATLTATATLTAVPALTLPVAAGLTGTATLAAGADRTAVATASLTATATLTAAAVAAYAPTASLAATAALTAGPALAALAAATLTGTAALTAGAVRTAVAGATLTGTATLTVGATLTAVAAATLTVTATLIAVSTPPGSNADLTATATLTAGAALAAIAGAALTATASFTAAAAVSAVASASLTATAALAAAAVRTGVAGASLTGTAMLTAGAVLAAVAAATLTATATLTAVGVVGSVAILSVTATLTAGAVRTGVGGAALTATATLTAAAQVVVVAAVVLSATASLAAAGRLAFAPAAALVLVVALAAQADVTQAFTVGRLTASAAATSGLTASTASTAVLTATSARGGPA